MRRLFALAWAGVAMLSGSPAQADDVQYFSQVSEEVRTVAGLAAIFVSAGELWGRSSDSLWHWDGQTWVIVEGPLPYPVPGATFRDVDGSIGICDAQGRWRYRDQRAVLIRDSPPCIIGFPGNYPMIVRGDGWLVQDEWPWVEPWYVQQQPIVLKFRDRSGLRVLEHPPTLLEGPAWRVLWPGPHQAWFGEWGEGPLTGGLSMGVYPLADGFVLVGANAQDLLWLSSARPPPSLPFENLKDVPEVRVWNEGLLIIGESSIFLFQASDPSRTLRVDDGPPSGLASYEISFFDLDLDACGDLLWLAQGRLFARFGVCAQAQAPPEFDGDGDGFSVSSGDCDDEDPSRNPGMMDICDGIDNDCDGLPDAPSLRVEGSYPSKNEGAPWTARVLTEGCISDYTLLIGPNGDLASCDLNEVAKVIECTLLDEGFVQIELSATAELFSGVEVPIRSQTSVEVSNVDPWIDGDSRTLVASLEDSGGAPEAIERQFVGHDLGATDLLSWRLEGAPPGMLISGEGLLIWRPQAEDRGSHWVTLILEDGDGGRADLNFFARYEGERSDSLDCCCLGSTAALGLPSLILLRARRREQRQRCGQNREEISRMSAERPLSTSDQPEP